MKLRKIQSQDLEQAEVMRETTEEGSRRVVSLPQSWELRRNKGGNFFLARDEGGKPVEVIGNESSLYGLEVILEAKTGRPAEMFNRHLKEDIVGPIIRGEREMG